MPLLLYLDCGPQVYARNQVVTGLLDGHMLRSSLRELWAPPLPKPAVPSPIAIIFVGCVTQGCLSPSWLQLCLMSYRMSGCERKKGHFYYRYLRTSSLVQAGWAPVPELQTLECLELYQVWQNKQTSPPS